MICTHNESVWMKLQCLGLPGNGMLLHVPSYQHWARYTQTSTTCGRKGKAPREVQTQQSSPQALNEVSLEHFLLGLGVYFKLHLHTMMGPFQLPYDSRHRWALIIPCNSEAKPQGTQAVMYPWNSSEPTKPNFSALLKRYSLWQMSQLRDLRARLWSSWSFGPPDAVDECAKNSSIKNGRGFEGWRILGLPFVTDAWKSHCTLSLTLRSKAFPGKSQQFLLVSWLSCSLSLFPLAILTGWDSHLRKL